MNKVSSSAAVLKRPLMSGSLWAIHRGDDVVNVQNIIDKTVHSYIQDLRDKVEQDLENDPNWAPLAGLLDIEVLYDDDGLEVVLSVDHPDAFELEYGTPERPMKPKLRPYAHEASIDLSEELEHAFKKAFG